MGRKTERLVNGVKSYCETVVRPFSTDSAFFMGLCLGMRMGLSRPEYCETFTDLTWPPHLRDVDGLVIDNFIARYPVE